MNAKHTISLLLLIMSPLWSIAQDNVQKAQPILGEVPQKTSDVFLPEVPGVKVEVWVDSLTIPWTLRFMPNGDALVAQRPGNIVRIPSGKQEQEHYFDVPDAVHEVDAGLMGLALHPDFENNNWIYIMHAYRNQEDQLLSRVLRLENQGNTARVDKVIMDNIPAYAIHLGGRIAFGPDENLYIGTGDMSQPFLAQDINHLASKILRITDEGEIPADNPFGNSPVYSYGHRVVQGFAWDPDTGAFFNSEHGPSGAEVEGSVRYRDEINKVEKGGNHGWPVVVGAPGMSSYVDPLAIWNQAAVPPAGMTFYKGDLFVASLGGQALVRLVFDKEKDYEVKRIERWFSYAPSKGIYGRFRDVTVGPDGNLYLTTSNTDGRAALKIHDDKILKLTFEQAQ
ncbi:quinoprotein glucose dehydrogenase [Cyclobacterium lianum]|uniref:Quinoprotein glucose dehydrogenase n=1 Tax=Cyclobacterium lianum TaxID=388280 RepID=A0A1M7NX98_9BACT|nr:PQQ-dependent sugar dehydrogenase [Cyclobacterium lianum]SHN08719.1 quinoprotein glucose dehydrogenase [Cyclobacterium lianum]